MLNYALKIAANMGSERMEIRCPPAARELGITDSAVQSGVNQLIKLGWVDVVEPGSPGTSARVKLQIGRDRTLIEGPCRWPGCSRQTRSAHGLCRRCWRREDYNLHRKSGKAIHKLQNLDIQGRTADCATCGVVTGVFIRRSQGKVRGICPAVERSIQTSSTARKYGLTVEQYTAMIDRQKGCCAICRSNDSLNVDHDHDFGTVRGLLCNRCNLAIGLLRDSPSITKAATKYLERHAQQKLPI